MRNRKAVDLSLLIPYICSMELKRLTVDDIPALRELGRKTFTDAFAALNTKENMRLYLEEAYAPEKLEAELTDPGSEFYFLLHETRPVAYLKLNSGSAQTEAEFQNSLEIERIYVLEAFQGQHIGQHLLDFCLQQARERKKDFIWLGVWEYNHGAIRFYERNGFQRFGSHAFHLGKDEQTDILMRLDLE